MTLFDKSSLIFEEIPEDIRQNVFNAILARAIASGALEEELLLYLIPAEVEEIKDRLGFEPSFLNPKRKAKRATPAQRTLFDNIPKASKKTDDVKASPALKKSEEEIFDFDL